MLYMVVLVVNSGAIEIYTIKEFMKGIHSLFLYCIGSASGLVKFGYSQDPLSRLRSLQTGNSEVLTLLETIAVEQSDRIRWLERSLHAEFSHRRVRGEWFRCSAEEGVNFLRWFEIHYL